LYYFYASPDSRASLEMTDKIEYYLKVTRGFRFYAVHAGAQKAAASSVKFRKKPKNKTKR